MATPAPFRVLDGQRFVVLDGGLSTALAEQGHRLDDHLWTARLLADDPEAIVQAHLAFLRAGARVLITASYQASVGGFLRAGIDAPRAHELIRRTTALAREAAERFASDPPSADLLAPAPSDAGPSVLVAASVGPYGAVLNDGSEYSGAYGRTHDELVAFHAERLADLVPTGPDLLAVETLPGAAEASAVAEALRTQPAVPTWVTFTCASAERTAAGDPIEEAVAAAVSSPAVVAVGVNCTAPQHVAGLLERIAAVTDLPLVAYPNSGQQWDSSTMQWRGEPVPLDGAAQWAALGAHLIGGCCGVGADGIRRLAAIA